MLYWCEGPRVLHARIRYLSNVMILFCVEPFVLHYAVGSALLMIFWCVEPRVLHGRIRDLSDFLIYFCVEPFVLHMTFR